MKKGKEWLKGRIKGFQEGENMFTAEFNAGVQDALEYVQELIDQLDEPEVLSQEWIDKNSTLGQFITSKVINFDKFVKADKLKNLIVPKQNKPVIPQFVADWIESQDDPIYEMCVNYEMWGVNGDDGTTRFTGEIAEWFDDTLNVENYYRACIDGYEVEKEPQWVVKIGKGYFSGYDETKVTYVLDNFPGEIARRIVYEDLNEAESDANDIGGEVEEVTE